MQFAFDIIWRLDCFFFFMMIQAAAASNNCCSSESIALRNSISTCGRAKSGRRMADILEKWRGATRMECSCSWSIFGRYPHRAGWWKWIDLEWRPLEMESILSKVWFNSDMRRLAYQLAKKNKLPNSFKNEMAGTVLVQRIFKEQQGSPCHEAAHGYLVCQGSWI